jgi:hypothetical protein
VVSDSILSHCFEKGILVWFFFLMSVANAVSANMFLTLLDGFLSSLELWRGDLFFAVSICIVDGLDEL